MMREGRWREIDRGETAQSESGRWPGADRRRGGQKLAPGATPAEPATRRPALPPVDRGAVAVGSASYGEQPREVRAGGVGRAFDWVQLGPVDRAAVRSIARTAGLDPAHVSNTFYVYRVPRHGFVVTFIEYEYDGDQLVLVLGEPVCRVHPVAVDTADVPESCR